MAGRVQGKVVIVTGGGSGLGAESARWLAREGAKVAVTDLNAEGAERVAEEIRATGAKAIGMAHDVCDEAAWEAVVARTQAELGPLDVLVNNAGVLLVKPIAETTLEDFRWCNRPNVEGVFLGTKVAFAAMGVRGGSIINLSSVAGIIGAVNHIAYNASKGAVRLMTKSAAMEAATLGYPIRVNSIHPAVMKTPMTEVNYGVGVDNEATDSLMSFHPVGRFGTPADVAACVVFLASEESGFFTGSEIVVDGGLTAGRATRIVNAAETH
ncbi:glucose 1-dehydrogenase [Zavarzinia sp. CC-PAN008]|uniref:glucose 1-dehydrogenase n=1 Tax=Zavarzinia sp. CC-PAN008 TaxID=3243332 RepID=UPI003F74776E